MNITKKRPPSFSLKEDFKTFQGFEFGDIIEVDRNGTKEYMIFTREAVKGAHVFFTSSYEVERPLPPEPLTWFQYFFGRSGLYWETPEGTTSRIRVESDFADEILKGLSYIKFNFADDVIPPNDPDIIYERVRFKACNPCSYPQFQNSKDWVVWCRYGKDIVATYRGKF